MKTKYKKIKEDNKTRRMKKHRKASFILFVVVLITSLLILIYNFTIFATESYSKSELVSTSLKINPGSLSSDKILPRHIFYHIPRVFSNPSYTSTCYPAGEIMDAFPDNKCCDSLKSLSIIDEAEQGCKFLVGATLCSDCGNKRCEYGENKCNCPNDCKKK